MTNPNLVRKPALDSGTTGEVSKSDILSTSLSTQNYIINGNMRISQRGNSFPAIAAGAYGIDRFKYDKAGAAVHTLSRDTDVPTLTQAGYLFQNSLRLNLTTPDNSLAATDDVIVGQYMEGFVFAPIAQKAFTLSFWVKATLAGTYCVSFRNGGFDRSYVAEYSILASNTWEYKTISVDASPSTGSWSYDASTGLNIAFCLASGTTYQTTAGAWQTGNFIATANQINGVQTGATDFKLTGIMLNVGTVAAPFSTYGKTFNAELQACQRYFEKSYRLDEALGAVNGSTGFFHSVAINGTDFYCHGRAKFQVPKRAVATISTWSYAGTPGVLTNLNSSLDQGNTGLRYQSQNGFGIFCNNAAMTTNSAVASHWAADAEL